MSLVVLLVFALGIVAKGAFCLDLSPTGVAAEAAVAQTLSFDGPVIDKEYKKNRLMQVMGYALLGASAAMIFGGAAMIEAAPWGAVSRVGISSTAAGLAHFVTAVFLLGFSKVILRQALPPIRPIRVIRKSASLGFFNRDIVFSGTEQGLF